MTTSDDQKMAKDLPEEKLDKWVTFILPEQPLDKLSREDKQDIYNAFIQEMAFLNEFIAHRSEKTKYPDRVFSRLMIQVGQTYDEQITQHINASQHSKEESGGDDSSS